MKSPKSKSSQETTHASIPIWNNSGKSNFFQSRSDSSLQFFGPSTIQPKLKIGKPNDKYEKEADRVADTVMRMPDDPHIQRQPVEEEEEELQMKRENTLIQRKCEECEEEEKLQKKSDGSAESTNQASSHISSQLATQAETGNRLPKPVRSEMAHKMGVDFSGVNIHIGPAAHKLSNQLGARAFTHGSDVYFNKGEYNPTSRSGKHLLAHELTHVVQQNYSKSKEFVSPPSIQRKVASRLVNCIPGQDGVPDRANFDPVEALRQVDGRAQALASATSNLLTFETLLDEEGEVGVSFVKYFGLPPEREGSFLNRLTGQRHDTQIGAQHVEMKIVARRLSLITDLFRDFIRYRCATNDCGGDRDAWVYAGVGTIHLCPSFWDLLEDSVDAAATLFIHEAAHIIWQRVDHGASGPGGNFRHAECYASFVSDIFGIQEGTPECPDPPNVEMFFESQE